MAKIHTKKGSFDFGTFDFDALNGDDVERVDSKTHIKVYYSETGYVDFGGTFKYASNGHLTGGSVTSISNISGRSTLWQISDFKISATKMEHWVLTGNTEAAIKALFSGSDTALGQGGNDTLYGFGGKDTIYGRAGNDTLYGGDGNDKVLGEAGNDKMYGGAGNDYLKGGTGKNEFFGGKGDDIYIVQSKTDTVSEAGGDGNDRIDAYVSFTLPTGVETLRLFGTATRGTGNDSANNINGGAKSETLSGLGGKDYITGGGGNDVIDGGAGLDTMKGGSGADKFVFKPGESGATGATADRILDFNIGDGDKIDLSAFGGNDESFTFIGGGAFSGGDDGVMELRSSIKGGVTYISGDVDANGAADFVIRLSGAHQLSEASLVL